MTPEMSFECLFVSRDPALCSTIQTVMRNFSIIVDHCLCSSEACQEIANGTHELVVIDWEGDASFDFMKAIWNLTAKKKPTTMVISDDVASVPGAHVTLCKPVTLDSGTKSLKTAYVRMLLDYRMHARHAVRVCGTAKDENGQSFAIMVTDLSEKGIGIRNSVPVVVGTTLSLTVPLGGAPIPLHLSARVVWARGYGTAGCEIVDMPPVDRVIFRAWLKARTQVKKPLIAI